MAHTGKGSDTNHLRTRPPIAYPPAYLPTRKCVGMKMQNTGIVRGVNGQEFPKGSENLTQVTRLIFAHGILIPTRRSI